jgi:hypothetical protein
MALFKNHLVSVRVEFISSHVGKPEYHYYQTYFTKQSEGKNQGKGTTNIKQD